MDIKEVILPEEKQRIIDFLGQFGLKYEDNIDQTIYMEDGDKIVATISASKDVIKCLAVSPEYRNENCAVTLVGEIIKRLHAAGIYHYQVFTKVTYRDIFLSLGFTLLIETGKVSVLEGGEGNINSVIEKMRVQLKFGLGLDSGGKSSDIACVVINGNPFTNGHLRLVEYAAERHKYVLVMIVEEEGSLFTFRERYAMAYLALKPYYNVLVLPSSHYVVSRATFPGYFLKTADEATQEYAEYDAMIFRNYFIPKLGIKVRYVGSETQPYMRIYNDTLRKILGNKLEVVPRFEEDGEVISAAKVRALLSEGKIEEALKYVPRSNYAIFKGMVLSRNE